MPITYDKEQHQIYFTAALPKESLEALIKKSGISDLVLSSFHSRNDGRLIGLQLPQRALSEEETAKVQAFVNAMNEVMQKAEVVASPSATAPVARSR